MTSLFDDLFSSMGLPVLLDELGETQQLTYTPAGASGVNLTGIVGPERTEDAGARDGRRKRRVREVTISTDPSGDYGGVASPSTAATVTIGGVQYAVESIEALTGTWVSLSLLRRTKVEVTREEYRK